MFADIVVAKYRKFYYQWTEVCNADPADIAELPYLDHN